MKNSSQKNRQKYLIVWGFVLTLLIGFLTLAACTPKQTSESGEATTANTTPIEFSMKSDCASCHTTEANTMSDTSCPQAIAHKDLSCISCHVDRETLEVTHAGLTHADKPDNKSTTDTVDPQMCISCHGDMEEMAEITKDSQVLTDSNKRVVNPHERPVGETHSENPATCINCHDNHSNNISKDAMKYCARCHHRGVFTCGNCHEVKDR